MGGKGAEFIDDRGLLHDGGILSGAARADHATAHISVLRQPRHNGTAPTGAIDTTNYRLWKNVASEGRTRRERARQNRRERFWTAQLVALATKGRMPFANRSLHASLPLRGPGFFARE